jgi:hypothetical protein
MYAKQTLFTLTNIYAGISSFNEKWKEQLQQEYIDSRKLPRKKKKKERKRILLDWHFANMSVF